MRKIDTAIIKVNTLPKASAKKEIPKGSKKDFVEKLASFIEENKKSDTKSKETNEVPKDAAEVEDVEDSEEEFDSAFLLNLVDLNLVVNQTIEPDSDVNLTFEINTEQVVGLPEMINHEEVKSDLVRDIEQLFSANDVALTDDVSEMVESIGEMQAKELLSTIDTQITANPELALKDVIEDLFSENVFGLEEYSKIVNIEDIEKNSQIVDSTIVDESREFNLQEIEPDENVEVIDEAIAIEDIEQADDTKVTEVDQEIIVEEQPVDLTNGPKTFEPVNRTNFVQEVSTPVQQVAQEDFVSTVESLMIEQTEETTASDTVTTARIQLTPDHLGKVSVQIEMTGKELTAKLIVEQHETKEWIDQQVAHLKEKLLAQEITVTKFQVVVDDNPTNNQFMSNEENPFFKQKEKDSQEKRKQQIIKTSGIDSPIQSEPAQHSDTKGISLFV